MATGIYQKSIEVISSWLDGFSIHCDKQQKFSVFGTSSYCRFVMKHLREQGFVNGCFISSVIEQEQIDSLPVLSLEQAKYEQFMFIIMGSLSNPEGQRNQLIEYGLEADFFSVPNGEYLCSEYIGDIYDREQLEQLKNKHAGETVFICGNGPSLKETDPRRIKNAVAMGANGICKLEGFHPDYYFMLDKEAPLYWCDEISKLKSIKLVPPRLRSCHFDQSNTIFYPTVYKLENSIVDPYYFGLPSGRTVVSAMIYFSIYMGFKRIVFIGVDNDYGSSQRNMHFSESYYPVKVDFDKEHVLDELVSKHKEGMSLALSVAKSYGVECFDASPRRNMNIPLCDFDRLSVF